MEKLLGKHYQEYYPLALSPEQKAHIERALYAYIEAGGNAPLELLKDLLCIQRIMADYPETL